MKLACVAGETSGDLLAASVLSGLREARPEPPMQFVGVGGPSMIGQGLEAWWTIDALSVRGYVEVLAALPRLLLMRRQLKARILSETPDLFLGVDAPDFNLGLELGLRRKGVRTVHFISPSVWAWRAERLAHIAKAVDHMLLVFPMEKKIYAEAGIPASFVGHPMADEIPMAGDTMAARRTLGLSENAPVIALLPGSRKAEIEHLCAPYLETAKRIQRARKDVQFVIPAANSGLRSRIEARIKEARLPDDMMLRVYDGQARDCLQACDTSLIASGTACLEAALLKKPMVIAYKMPRLSYMRMRDMGYLPYVGLPNILCGGWIVPEFIQDKVEPKPMARALLQQLDSPSFREELHSRFSDLHLSLRQDCAHKSAEKLLELAERR